MEFAKDIVLDLKLGQVKNKENFFKNIIKNFKKINLIDIFINICTSKNCIYISLSLIFMFVCIDIVLIQAFINLI